MKTTATYLKTTESQRGEKSNISDSAQKLALLGINAEEGFILISGEFRIITFTRSFQKIYLNFCTKELIEDESLLDYAPACGVENLKSICQKAVLGHEATEEIELTLADQSIRIFSFRYKPAFDEYTDIIGVCISLKDITSQKEAEKKIQQHEKRYQALVENSGDTISVLTAEGKLLYTSPSIKNISGYSEQEAMKLDLFSLVHPDDLEVVGKVWEEMLSKPGIPMPRYTGRLLHKDGSWRWVEATVTNMLHDPYIGGIVDNFRDVTERKIAELQLKENEEKYRTLIEQAFDGIVIYSIGGTILDSNNSANNFLGYSKDELKNLAITDLFFKDDLIKRPLALELLGSGQSFKDYRRLRSKDGSCIEVEIRTKRLPDGNLMAVARDITEWKAAERQREFDRTNLKALINNTTDLIWSVDKNLKLITSNDAFDEKLKLLMGHSNKTGSGIPGGGLTEGILNHWKNLYERVFAGEAFTEILHTASPEESWSEVSFYPICKGNEIIGTACYSRDITEKKKSEKIIRDERLLLRTLIDNIPMNVYAKDIYSRKTLANRADCEFMGVASEKDVLGKSDAEFFPSAFAEETFKEEKEMFCTGKAIAGVEEQHTLKNGSTKWFLKSKIPLKNENEQIIGLVGISYDITERKHNEIAIRELNDLLNRRAVDLIASNAELERFAYVASHDLQEPLRMVSSFLQLLQRKYRDQLDETAGQYISYAVDGADRMKKLILDLLEYSRVGTNKEVLADTDMNEVVAQVLVTFSTKTAEAGAAIFAHPMPVIKANKIQMIQLIQNLVSNSLKYNNSPVPAIEIGCEDTGCSWLFSVKDNGIGIEQRFFDKVFVIFQRLHNKSQFSGTGIGLAICKKITERHGGTIWIESRPGEGSTFLFTIKK